MSLIACKKEDAPPIYSIEDAFAKATDLGYSGTVDDFADLVKDKRHIGIISVSLNENNELIITLLNDETINCGKIEKETPPYNYANSKEVLEYVVLIQNYINCATNIYNNLIASNNYNIKQPFSYDDCINFYYNNRKDFSVVSRNFEACKTLLKEMGNDYKYACAYLAESLQTCTNTFTNYSKTIDNYVQDVHQSLQMLKINLENFEEYIAEKGEEDLKEYKQEREQNKLTPEVSLNYLINKATLLHSILSSKRVYSEINGLDFTLISIAENIFDQLNQIKNGLIEKYNTGIAKSKIEETYEILDNIYLCHVDIQANNQSALDELCSLLNVNLEVLKLIN